MFSKKYINILAVLIFVYLFVNFSNNIPLICQEILSSYFHQLLILVSILLIILYVDKFIGILFFILFFIQFRLSYKN